MKEKLSLGKLSRRTKILSASLVALLGIGIGTGVTISDHQNQVKTAQNVLHQEIDTLADLQKSDYLTDETLNDVKDKIDESEQNLDKLQKFSELKRIKSETKNVKRDITYFKSIISRNKSSQDKLLNTINTAEAYLKNQNISPDEKTKLLAVLKTSKVSISDKAFDKMSNQTATLTIANQSVQSQINQTSADKIKTAQPTLEIQKSAQDLLNNSFTSETDKKQLTDNLSSIASAKDEKSINAAISALKSNITAVKKHNKPSEDKAKAEAEKKAAEAAKAEADRKAAEAAQAAQAAQVETNSATTNTTASNKWAIEDGYNWHNRKGHSTVIPPGGSLPAGYHWQVP